MPYLKMTIGPISIEGRGYYAATLVAIMAAATVLGTAGFLFVA